MTVRRSLLALGVATALLAGTGSVSSPADARPRPGQFSVGGDVEQTLNLTVADLEALPQQTLEVTFQSGSTTETHTCTGPLLLDVLNLATPTFDPAIKNDKLRHFVAVTGSEGYRVVIAWGEFDPDFEAKTLLLATTEDGVSLADAGPRLVVPGDRRGGRYVTNVVTIRLAPMR
jgi:molybdopterin-dependent oxidoreductase-like protein protein